MVRRLYRFKNRAILETRSHNFTEDRLYVIISYMLKVSKLELLGCRTFFRFLGQIWYSKNWIQCQSLFSLFLNPVLLLSSLSNNYFLIFSNSGFIALIGMKWLQKSYVFNSYLFYYHHHFYFNFYADCLVNM